MGRGSGQDRRRGDRAGARSAGGRPRRRRGDRGQRAQDGPLRPRAGRGPRAGPGPPGRRPAQAGALTSGRPVPPGRRRPAQRLVELEVLGRPVIGRRQRQRRCAEGSGVRERQRLVGPRRRLGLTGRRRRTGHRHQPLGPPPPQPFEVHHGRLGRRRAPRYAKVRRTVPPGSRLTRRLRRSTEGRRQWTWPRE